MDIKVKSAKLSKILIISSIATGVTLSGAYLIYKHNKDNKQYKRNSNSNFSITIHLSKDQVHKGKFDNKTKDKEAISEEDEQSESEIHDFNEYVESLPSSEEKNFFLDLYDKFMNIFSKKEDLLDDTIIITKPNEALYTLDDSVEIDENNDTIIITKPNEFSTSSPIDRPNSDENVKILNEVIEQTINLVNNNNNDNDSNDESLASTSSITSTSTKTLKNKKNFDKNIIATNDGDHNNDININNSIHNSESLSAQSSSSTLIDKHEFSSEELQNSSFDNSFIMKNIMSEVEITEIKEAGDEDDFHENKFKFEEIIKNNNNNKNIDKEKIGKDSYPSKINTNYNNNINNTLSTRKRKETITTFNFKKYDTENELMDSENENIVPSTPKMSFSSRNMMSPMSTVSRNNNIIQTPKIDKMDNESINPLSIDINQLLMSQNFEFSDEEGEYSSETETIDNKIHSNGKTLHRASSISSTSTFQSAKSSWTEGHSFMEDSSLNHEPLSHSYGNSINGNSKDQLSLNDESWEVNSVCSSTSGYNSAQEEFIDANMD